MTRYQTFLAAAFAAVWLVAAWEPLNRGAWLLENLLVFAFIPFIIITGRYFKLSDVSYTLITLFLMLHVAGSHWTYAHVPFGFELGEWLGIERNLYDRFVHFFFGFLLAYPIREAFVRVTGARGFWGYLFPPVIVLSLSAMYEILEWLAVTAVAVDTSVLFLATQGDELDAAKDMGAALLGTIIATGIALVLNLVLNKEEFRPEFKESFRVPGERRAGRVPLKDIVR